MGTDNAGKGTGSLWRRTCTEPHTTEKESAESGKGSVFSMEVSGDICKSPA